MVHTRICSEIITRAAQAAGGDEALAQLLGEDAREVRAWAQGTRLAPFGVYLKALDLLSSKQQQRN